MDRAYYVVYAKGQAHVLHIMQDDWFGTGSTPTGLLAPRKKTLSGLVAVKNVSDMFTVDEADCRECSRPYESR
jgi:hypothetical protein